MTLEQLAGYFGMFVFVCGMVANVLPQRWAFTKALTRLGALTLRATTKHPPISGVVIALFAFGALQLTGCAGTFEEAKLAGAQSRAAAPPSAVSPPVRCQSLSERQYWFTGTGLTLTAAGVAIAGLALPAKTDKIETILLISGASTTVTGGGLTWLGNSAGVNYQREGCAAQVSK